MRSFGRGGGFTPGSVRPIRMLQGLDRAVRPSGASVPGSHDSFSPAASSATTSVDGRKDALTTTSPPSPGYLPLPATSSEQAWPCFLYPVDDGDAGDWVCVDAVKDDKPLGHFDGHVFGSIPSIDEVQAAVSSLQGVLGHATSGYGVKYESVWDGVKDDSVWGGLKDKSVCYGVKDESVWDGVRDESVWDGVKDESVWDGVKDESVCEFGEGVVAEGFSRTDSSSGTSIGNTLDWIEPSMQLYNSNMLQRRHGYDGVYDALYMLQYEPAVQRMVASLSSDGAVWEAVLNNVVVRDIRESLSQAAVNSSVSSEASESGDFLSSFIANVKAKIKGLIDSLRVFVNGLTRHQGSDEAAEVSEGDDAAGIRQVKVSFMLAMMVFLIVVLKRIDKA